MKRSPYQTTIIVDRTIKLSSDDLYAASPNCKRLQQVKATNDHVFEVDVEKGDDGLGLSLVGGRDSDIVYEGMYQLYLGLMV